MFFRSMLVATATITTLACSSVSATTYDAFSHLQGKPVAPEHSLWFSGSSNPAGASGPKANHFLFENSKAGKGTFTTNGSSASVTGTVRNAAGQGFRVLLNLVQVADPGVYKNPYGADTSKWTFYGLDLSKSNMLTSLSAGVASFHISLRGAPLAAQFGIGANDKNANTLGFSTWINMTQQNCFSNCQRYAGDFNLSLQQQPSPVPLPASIALLPAAFGALGAVGLRRRRKSKQG